MFDEDDVGERLLRHVFHFLIKMLKKKENKLAMLRRCVSQAHFKKYSLEKFNLGKYSLGKYSLGKYGLEKYS